LRASEEENEEEEDTKLEDEEDLEGLLPPSKLEEFAVLMMERAQIEMDEVKISLRCCWRCYLIVYDPSSLGL
jgi:hypothetical protein